jgi:hypothetical protein
MAFRPAKRMALFFWGMKKMPLFKPLENKRPQDAFHASSCYIEVYGAARKQTLASARVPLGVTLHIYMYASFLDSADLGAFENALEHACYLQVPLCGTLIIGART